MSVPRRGHAIAPSSGSKGSQMGGVTMLDRRLFVSSAVALFTSAAFCCTPAAATPCTNLAGLPLHHGTITSASDQDTGVFVTPTTPPSTLTNLPPFCRVTATL